MQMGCKKLPLWNLRFCCVCVWQVLIQTLSKCLLFLSLPTNPSRIPEYIFGSKDFTETTPKTISCPQHNVCRNTHEIKEYIVLFYLMKPPHVDGSHSANLAEQRVSMFRHKAQRESHNVSEPWLTLTNNRRAKTTSERELKSESVSFV